MYATIKDINKYTSKNPYRPFIQVEYAHAMGNSLRVILTTTEKPTSLIRCCKEVSYGTG